VSFVVNPYLAFSDDRRGLPNLGGLAQKAFSLQEDA
jgi:hypothetical protein